MGGGEYCKRDKKSEEMNKDFARMALMLGAVSAMFPLHDPCSQKYTLRELSPAEEDELKRLREQQERLIKQGQGLKEWDIDGVKVWGVNKKNAIRKANKLKQMTDESNI